MSGFPVCAWSARSAPEAPGIKLAGKRSPAPQVTRCSPRSAGAKKESGAVEGTEMCLLPSLKDIKEEECKKDGRRGLEKRVICLLPMECRLNQGGPVSEATLECRVFSLREKKKKKGRKRKGKEKERERGRERKKKAKKRKRNCSEAVPEPVPRYEPCSTSSFYTQAITLDSTTHYKP